MTPSCHVKNKAQTTYLVSFGPFSTCFLFFMCFFLILIDISSLYLCFKGTRRVTVGSDDENGPKWRQTCRLGHRYVFLFVISILTYPFQMARWQQLQQQRPDRYDECDNSDNKSRQPINCVCGHHHHSEMENRDGDRDRDREMGAKRRAWVCFH